MTSTRDRTQEHVNQKVLLVLEEFRKCTNICDSSFLYKCKDILGKMFFKLKSFLVMIRDTISCKICKIKNATGN